MTADLLIAAAAVSSCPVTGVTQGSLNAWVGVLSIMLAALAGVIGWAWGRGRAEEKSRDQGERLTRVEEQLEEKFSRVADLDRRITRAEERVRHMNDGIKRADAAVEKLAERIERLSGQT